MVPGRAGQLGGMRFWKGLKGRRHEKEEIFRKLVKELFSTGRKSPLGNLIILFDLYFLRRAPQMGNLKNSV